MAKNTDSMKNMDFAKNSRFTVINMMREKSNLAPCVWNEFVTLDWATIETITEEARLAYNAAREVENNYRKSQFSNIKTSHSEFNVRVKFIQAGETKWLDITDVEFETIKNILTI